MKVRFGTLLFLSFAFGTNGAHAMPCPSIVRGYGVGFSWADRYCAIGSVAGQTSDPAWKSCMDKMRADGESGERSLNLCLDPSETSKTLDLVGRPAYPSCLSSLRSIGIAASSPSLCRNYLAEFPGDFDANAFGHCVDLGFRHGARGFWDRREANVAANATRQRTYPFSALAAILRDCGRGAIDSPKNPAVTVLGEIAYATGTTLPPAYHDVEIGGLSGVNYDAEAELLRFVSDDKTVPRIMVAKLGFNPQDGRISIRHQDPIFLPIDGEDHGKYHDNEDLLRLPNGNLLVSSEMDSAGLLQMAAENEGVSPHTSLLREIDIAGENRGNWPMPPAYLSRRKAFHTKNHQRVWVNDPAPKKKITPLAPPPKASEIDFIFPGIAKKAVPAEGTPPTGHWEEREVEVTDYRLTSGITPNAGFEALGISPDLEQIFVANEMPMIQDRRKDASSSPLRLTLMDARNGGITRGVYGYPLENREDNGLVAMAPYSRRQFLALERAFDHQTATVSARIYDIDLSGLTPGQTIPVSRKRLVVDLDSLLPEFAPGFRQIDNYEGMAFGPTLADGRRTLILVSDNNFNPAQRTSILFLALRKKK